MIRIGLHMSVSMKKEMLRRLLYPAAACVGGLSLICSPLSPALLRGHFPVPIPTTQRILSEPLFRAL